MFDTLIKTSPIRFILFAGLMGGACMASAQATPAASDPGASVAEHARAYQAAVVAYAKAAKSYLSDRREVALAGTYESAGANLTYASPITFQGEGGGLELSAQFRDGFGAVASIHGFHSSDSGHGVPVNLIVDAFGPRYTFRGLGIQHPVNIFVQGLIGEANGIAGLYPSTSGPLTNASSFAAEAGGGVDIAVSPRFAVRLLQADWIRTGLPNGTDNVQNTLRLGVGIVLHTAHRQPNFPVVIEGDATAEARTVAEKNEAEALKAKAEADAVAARADATAARAEAEDAKRRAELSQNDAVTVRQKLRTQLNEVLSTTENARGLIVYLSDILFDTGSYTIRPSTQIPLTKVATILQIYPTLKIQVEGYTDSVGGDAYNQKLSEDRANAVASFLVKNGVPAANATAAGYGKSSPVADNNTADGRTLNRRVNLVVSGDAIGIQTTPHPQ